jgi:hypothetical protein
VAAVLAACGGGGGSGTTATSAPHTIGATTPEGLQTGPPPWPPEYAHLRERLDKDGIPALKVEGTAMDLHAFVVVVFHGRQVTVPSLVGVNGREESGRILSPPDGFVSPLHTHDSTGLIHIHSPVVRTYTLGEFFDVWGVRFDAACLGECAGDGTGGTTAGGTTAGATTVRVFDNGRERTGDPRAIALEALHVYVVTFGTQAETPTSIPDRFPGA